jgi:hypothetical protein
VSLKIHLLYLRDKAIKEVDVSGEAFRVVTDDTRRLPIHQRLGPRVPTGNCRRISIPDEDG